MYLKIYFYILLSPLFIIILHFFFKWQIRRLMMQMVAKKLNLRYIGKSTAPISNEELLEEQRLRGINTGKIKNLIEGKISGKEVKIYERQVISGVGPRSLATMKILNIIIDGKTILVKKYSEILFPLPGKIVFIIIDYIKNNRMPTLKKFNSALLLVILVFSILPLIILLGIMAAKIDGIN